MCLLEMSPVLSSCINGSQKASKSNRKFIRNLKILKRQYRRRKKIIKACHKSNKTKCLLRLVVRNNFTLKMLKITVLKC